MARDPNYDDLMGLDLSRLDLDDIDLDIEPPPSGAWRWFAALLIVGAAAVVLWLPSSELYQIHGNSGWLFFAVCGAAALIGLTFGRWLWEWAQEAAARYAERLARRGPRPVEPERPPSALARWMTLLGAVGGGAALLLAIPPDFLAGGGSGYGGHWFLVAGGAIAVGLLLGRWLLMQGNMPASQRPTKPVELPPWFKWVTLAFLIGGALFVLFGSALFPNSQQSAEFSFGGLGFVLGILGAVWLVRRFDEAEKRIRQETLRKRLGAAESVRKFD